MNAWRQALHRLRLERAWGISHLRHDTARAQRLLAELHPQQQPPDESEADTRAQPAPTVAESANAHATSAAAAPVATQVPAESEPVHGDRDDHSANVKQRLTEMAEQVATCTRCHELRNRRRPAFSDGTPHTPLMFVGEAPGEQEDKAGVPFVGRAGQKLTEIIEKGLAHAIRQVCGLNEVQHVPRSSVYIANVLKCRPPGNRDPKPEEVENCREYLSGQIALVRPVVICALGLPASRRLLGVEHPMHKLRGRRFALPEREEITVVPTYHPSFLLQQYTAENRRKVMEDVTEVVRVLDEAGAVPWWT